MRGPWRREEPEAERVELPARLGPFRLEAPLGRGGMGQLYRAYDTRLDRWVALKVIRAEAALDPRSRERLRREARAAARLTHPAIVQIHDILQYAGGEAVVMELVDGSTVAARITGGPFGVLPAVDLGLEVAEALVVAHAHGILHRDLKAENVMVTPAGRAKVLDFGLARRFEGSGDDTSLSDEGAVVGTYRAMSPEQARARPLDARSDLFSLGVLLYEVLTGRSPFRAPSAADTLLRVCTLRQPPVVEVRPQVPTELSELVDALMEKEPSRRPGSASEVAARLGRIRAGLAETPREGASPGTDGAASEETWWTTTRPRARGDRVRARLLAAFRGGRGARRWAVAAVLIAIASVAGWRVARTGRGQAEPFYVVVARPAVSAGADLPGVDLLAGAMREAVVRALLEVEGARPLAGDSLAGTPLDVARALAAHETLVTTLACRAETCRVDLSRVSASDGSVRWAGHVQIPLSRQLLAGEAVSAALGGAYEGRLRRAVHSADPTVTPADYAAYLRVRQGAYPSTGAPALSLDERIARMREVRSRAPRFVEAQVGLALLQLERHRERRDKSDVDAALQLLEEAGRTAPHDPRIPMALVDAGLAAERLDLADAALRELLRLQPGDPDVWMQQARVLDRRGRTDEALALMREAVAGHASWTNLFRLAQLEFRHGNKDAARAHLEDLLRRLPGQRAARSFLAQIELLHGSPARAAELYSGLAEEQPGPTELTNLGLALLLLARYSEAEARLRSALDLAPKNPLIALNLADVVLLQHRGPQAAALYRRALDLAEGPTSDWQVLSVRAQALAHLERHSEAVRAVQEVIRLAAGNPQAAFEVAVVYALLGDDESAVFNGSTALAQGVDRRWFALPWFDAVRSRLEPRADGASAATPESGRADRR
jgi:eukaryotic-like serine/threonine-protein kinase